jgi:hypothetical protein
VVEAKEIIAGSELPVTIFSRVENAVCRGFLVWRGSLVIQAQENVLERTFEVSSLTYGRIEKDDTTVFRQNSAAE